MNGGYVLDACALIAYFKEEEGMDTMLQFFKRAIDGEISLFMHRINLLEVYYGFYRDDGKENAEAVLADSLSLPITIVDNLGDAFFREAGRIKASFAISLAGSCALALASTRGDALVTADRHEFGAIENKDTIRFSWIR